LRERCEQFAAKTTEYSAVAARDSLLEQTMGNEANCTLKSGKRNSSGKALLETSEIIFRPDDRSPRIRIPFASMRTVKAEDGELRIEAPEGTITLDLGPSAEKWLNKILHPKSRVEKLGVKSGTNISLLGDFDGDFLKEVRATTKQITEGKIDSKSEIIFLAVVLAKNFYPKGKKVITENDVLTSGRQAGLKDVKVVGFSPTHTALKFVLPLGKR
jgi:hypothetical protein